MGSIVFKPKFVVIFYCLARISAIIMSYFFLIVITMYMLWVIFILTSSFIFLGFKFNITNYPAYPKPKEIKLKPSIKLTTTSIMRGVFPFSCEPVREQICTNYGSDSEWTVCCLTLRRIYEKKIRGLNSWPGIVQIQDFQNVFGSFTSW